MPTVYFIRHGKTRWNEEGRLQGQPKKHLSLTSGGRNLVSLLIRFMHANQMSPMSIHSSPQDRAKETGGMFLNAFDIPHFVHPDLTEIDFGDYEGMTKVELSKITTPDGISGDELRRRHQSMDPCNDDNRHPNGESKREVRERFQPELADIVSHLGPNDSTLIVMHKGVFRIGVAPLHKYFSDFSLGHNDIVKVTFDQQEPLHITSVQHFTV